MPENCIVEVAPISGCAIITTPDGKMYTFTPKEGVRDIGKTNINMFLQPALAAQLGAPIETWKILDEYPFDKITKQIKQHLEIRDALRCFIFSLDPELPQEMRQKFARRAGEAFKDDIVHLALRDILINNPMLPEADTTCGPIEGRAGEVLREMIKKWRS